MYTFLGWSGGRGGLGLPIGLGTLTSLGSGGRGGGGVGEVGGWKEVEILNK